METNNKISEIFAKRREQNKIDQQRRIKEIYSKIPKMESLEKNIKEIGYLIIQNGLKGLETRELEEKLDELIAFKKELLRQNGFAEDYDQIRYKHALCKDTGFVGTQMCICRKQLIIDQNYSQSNIRNLIDKENFDKFDYSLLSDNPYKDYPISPRENARRVNEFLKAYVENFANESRNIYIFGEVGRGKTFLLNAIAKEILDRNYSVLYMSAGNLFKFLNDYNWAFEENRGKHQEQFDFILNCDLLIIDDLGSEASSKNDSSNLFEVINERMIGAKPIIFSTNFDETMLSDRYGARIFSRIVGNSEVIEIFGEDLRLKKDEYRRLICL